MFDRNESVARLKLTAAVLGRAIIESDKAGRSQVSDADLAIVLLADHSLHEMIGMAFEIDLLRTHFSKVLPLNEDELRAGIVTQHDYITLTGPEEGSVSPAIQECFERLPLTLSDSQVPRALLTCLMETSPRIRLAVEELGLDLTLLRSVDS
jgi:hypothetical protein